MKRMARGAAWTPEEDDIVLRITNSEECLAALEAAGFHRTRNAVLARRKQLQRDNNGTGQHESRRAALEAEIRMLEQRLRHLREELVELRIAQVRDAFGDIPVPEEILDTLRAEGAKNKEPLTAR